MIIKNTKLSVTNRCGIWLVRTIQVYNVLKKYVFIGFFLKSSNRVVSPTQSFLKKKKNRSYLIRTKRFFNKPDGTAIFFYGNSTLILKKRMAPKGRSVVGPSILNLKRRKAVLSFVKLL